MGRVLSLLLRLWSVCADWSRCLFRSSVHFLFDLYRNYLDVGPRPAHGPRTGRLHTSLCLMGHSFCFLLVVATARNKSHAFVVFTLLFFVSEVFSVSEGFALLEGLYFIFTVGLITCENISMAFFYFAPSRSSSPSLFQ